MSFMDEYQKALDSEMAKKASSTSNKKSSSSASSGSSNRSHGGGGGSFGGIGSFNNYMQNKTGNAFGSLAPTYASYIPASSITSRMTVGKKKKDEDKDKKWYEKGHFEDGWDFGDITKTILGVPDKKELKTFEAPDTTDSLEVLKQKSDYYKSRNWNNADQLAEANKYNQQYNQKALAEYSEKLSKTKMDGQGHTVLEEIEILANMKSGKEKDERKQAVLDKMESLGMDTALYPHFAGDGEFNWSDFGNWIKSSASAGLGSFNKMVTDTADVLIGAPLKEMGWENNPVSKLNEYYTNAYDNLKYNQQLYAEKLGGGAWDFAGGAVEGTAGAVPAAILAIMTAGTSLAGTSSSLATNAAYQTGNVLTKAGITAETMMKNPQFWTSFTQSLGSNFKEAKEKGVNDAVAAVGSVLSSMFTSGIEIGIDGGSGIQGLPRDLLEEGGSKWWKWIESAFEEGGEEGLQKLVDEGVSKFVYGLDEDYLNPIEYGRDMALGTIAGFALGGGQVATQSTVDAIQDYNAKKQSQNPLINQEIETEDHPIVEQAPKVEQEIKPEVDEVKPVVENAPVEEIPSVPTVSEMEKFAPAPEEDLEFKNRYAEMEAEQEQAAFESKLDAEVPADAPVANPVEIEADNSELTTPAPTFPERAELEVLKDERKVLEDTLMSMVTVNETGDKFQELSKKWSEVNSKIEAYENNLTDGEGSTGDIAPTEARTDAPYFVSEDVASIVDNMVTQDTEAGEGTFADPYVVYSVDDYVIQRRISRDGQKYSYTIISPDGAFRRGLVDQNAGAFYADVADKLTNLMIETGEYSNEVDAAEVEESNYPTGVAATAPVRVVSTDKGDYLKSDNSGFDENGYSSTNKIPGKQARILTEQPKVSKTQDAKKTDSLDVDTSKKGKLSPIKKIEEYYMDNGFVFEKWSKKTKNRSLEAKWNFTRYSRGMAQHLIAHGSKADNVPSLKSIAKKVEKAGLTQDFYNYLGHYRNIDGMTLDVRYNTTNKGVFGNDVTAAMSQTIVGDLEKQHPEFKQWAEEVYAYNRYLLDMSVEGGLITQKLAGRLKDMYPHYVPISRVGMESEITTDNSDHVGVNSPVKHATGGNQDILPFFDTMANRTLATFNAVNMNDFGVELFSTLYPGRSTKNTSLYPGHSNVGMMVEDLDSLFDPQKELLQFGENGKNPTFSVFMDGERHTFDITNEMYEALKPASDVLSYKVPVLSELSDIRRKLITEYNPWFLLKNAIKDTQDVLINSQHPIATYATMPKAMLELWTNGQYYQEYLANGGDQNSYFDTQSGSLMDGQKAIDKAKKIFGLDAISKANNFVETLPRLAEYIASRNAGRSIQVSMLDAARVTTNFAAGGQATKFLNRNGATFLNASVQGAIQFGRNIVEAKQNGLKGWVSLAARWTAAGFVPVILNHLMWDDDEDYQELPDYIRQNYYVVAKYGDGQFLRLPKGRVAAVLQEAVEQLDNATAENGKVDWDALYNIFMENIAPNNPATDNVFAPIGQVIRGKTWYGEDIEPYRLRVTHDEDGNEMEVPVTQRYDEKTSDPSIWLSEQLQDIPLTKWMDLSPKEIHYLMDQYSGIIGDTFLPMFTPKAESPIDNKAMKLLAPLRDIFTTDSVLNSRVTGDFYDTLEAAEAKAESEYATPEDKFESGMLIGYNAEISDLMKEQRKIQTSDLPDSEKYKRNRELKEQINALQEKGLEALKDYKIDGVYAEAGDKRYNYDPEDDTWWEIKPKLADGKDNYYYQQEQRITKDLGISYKEYWNKREMYDDFYYVAGGYDKDSSADDTIETARAVFGYERFAEYAKDLKEIKADKDKNGNPISGTKYPKVQAYVNSLDIPDIEKKILYTMQYPNYKKYKKEIVKYLDANDDISYEQYYKILDELGYKVDSKGYVKW